MTSEQVAFGSRLRRERERRQVSLSSVAESTKINKSLLASLERGDASHWPRGIYRRAFLREYAAAIGLPSDSIMAEFRDLFPESGEPAPSWTPADSASDLRLTFAPERHWPAHTAAIRAAAAIFDGAAVMATSAAVAILLQVSIWSATVIFALMYYSLATASLGGSPALFILNAGLARRTDPSRMENHPRAGSRELLHIVAAPTRRELQSPQPDLAAQPFVQKARSAS